MVRRQMSSRVRAGTRPAALAATIAALRRRYGDHIIRTGADLAALPAATGLAPLSTGSLGLDLITGGLPRGHVSEYAGADGTGKGTLALAALAACQRAGGLALLVDADGAADPDALAAAGVDLDTLVLACPTTVREAWDVLAALSRCGALDLLVLASLPGMLALPRAGWSMPRLDRQLPRLVAAVRGRVTALLLTNLPLPPRPGATADTWETVGGPAIAQAAALRIALQPTGIRFTDYGDVAALRATARVVKHHGMALGPALPLDITPCGPHRAAELVALGRLVGCVAETALGLVMGEHILGRTVGRAVAALERDPALAALVEAQVRASWNGNAVHLPHTGTARR